MSAHAYERLHDPGGRGLAGLLKVLGDPNRLAIVLTLGAGRRSVSEIIEVTGLPQTLVSFHLRVLRRSGLVRTVRQGSFIHYSLVDPDLIGLLAELARRVGAGLPDAARGCRG
ncbi:MAG TPA: metalloregulator ArsR/SmtB family transcription factor [Candidatus Methanoperedens sp.]|nr:metalloregulator ArsR/SmtB family transcription factor [Candidatus Methanoperedens sp.]